MILLVAGGDLASFRGKRYTTTGDENQRNQSKLLIVTHPVTTDHCRIAGHERIFLHVFYKFRNVEQRIVVSLRVDL